MSEDNKGNQRVVLDVPNERPNVWQISKVERVNPVGVHKATLYQTEFNPHTDYIEKDENGKIIGMWADYFTSEVEPVSDVTPSGDNVVCELTASNNQIKVGGSYKTITAKFVDNGTDVTDNYSLALANWHCYVDDIDITEDLAMTISGNKLKAKFPKDTSYLNKVLTVRCTVDDIVGEINFDIISV